MRDKIEGESVRLVGKASGGLGFGQSAGVVKLENISENRTRLSYSYSANVGGKVAAVGQRMLGTVTKLLIGQFFRGFLINAYRNVNGNNRRVSIGAVLKRLFQGRY